MLQASGAMAQRVVELMRSEYIALELPEIGYASERLLRMARLRHVPVLARDGRLAGVLSHRDVMEALRERVEGELGRERVEALLRTSLPSLVRAEVVAVEPDCPPPRAARLMLTHGIGFLPVVGADGRMLGIVTEADLLRAAYAAGG